KILEEEGVPNDFKYLPLIESGFRDVISPSGAVGFWQFLSSTAKLYNLEIKNEVDERYHVEKSTRAACAYLKTAKDKFGSWTTAAASYNLGMQAMAERCKSQGTYNYYELLLPQETARYIFRIIAMKIIFSNPEAAGYYLKPDDLYQPFAFKTVQVDSSIQNITAFAAKFGLQYRHIKLLNPWLRDNYLNNKEKKVYEIKILQ
ncbi:MAG: lytic transglycosylase domain-containing protein, partial [Chitinophagales bacterium]|nr:lytic transglycosylase domain-containing protein [Chitinophagales bacterium]